MRHMRLIAVAAGAAALFIGCGGRQQQAFEPREKTTGQSASGYIAAEYDLRAGDRYMGEAKVWSDGAFRRQIEGATIDVIHVGFEIQNQLGSPIDFIRDQLYLSSATLGRNVVQDIRPVQVQGQLQIPAGDEQRIDAYFSLPPGTKPNDVSAFRVHWRISNGQVSYTQRTPFTASKDPQETAYFYYYTPFYDPFFYDPFLFHPRVIVHRYPYRHYHFY